MARDVLPVEDRYVIRSMRVRMHVLDIVDRPVPQLVNYYRLKTDTSFVRAYVLLPRRFLSLQL